MKSLFKKTWLHFSNWCSFRVFCSSCSFSGLWTDTQDISLLLSFYCRCTSTSWFGFIKLILKKDLLLSFFLLDFSTQFFCLSLHVENFLFKLPSSFIISLLLLFFTSRFVMLCSQRLDCVVLSREEKYPSLEEPEQKWNDERKEKFEATFSLISCRLWMPSLLLSAHFGNIREASNWFSHVIKNEMMKSHEGNKAWKIEPFKHRLWQKEIDWRRDFYQRNKKVTNSGQTTQSVFEHERQSEQPGGKLNSDCKDSLHSLFLFFFFTRK